MNIRKKRTIFRIATLSISVEVRRHFGGTYRHLLGQTVIQTRNQKKTGDWQVGNFNKNAGRCRESLGNFLFLGNRNTQTFGVKATALFQFSLIQDRARHKKKVTLTSCQRSIKTIIIALQPFVGP
jgi:uncharacterized protein YcbK (DUF882 family)